MWRSRSGPRSTDRTGVGVIPYIMPILTVFSRTVFLPLVVVVLSASRSHAQDLDSLPVGSRISISLPDTLRPFFLSARIQTVTGTLARVTPDSIYVSVRSSAPFGVSRREVHGVSVSRGESRKWSALQSAALFGMAGVATAALDDNRFPRSARFWLGASVGGIAGAIWPFESWKRVRK